MDISLKASLREHLQKWLDQNAEELGDVEEIWQDITISGRNALMLANACEVVIDSMRLQNELRQELNSEGKV